MGLGIGVGSLAYLIDIGDLESADYLRADFAQINLVLAENELPPHHEPESLPTISSRSPPGQLGYSFLPFFVRAIAYARQAPEEFTPVGEEDPAEDRLLDRELSVEMDSHIICHSECEGYYVPVDFPDPICDDRVLGGWLGSSQGALAELVLAAPLLAIPLRKGKLSDKAARVLAEEDEGAHPCWRERRVWLKFFEAARNSIAFGTAISFG
jgi:hypothetical protein